MRQPLTYLSGCVLLLVGVRLSYAKSTAEAELIKQYEFMHRIFHNARRRIDAAETEDEQRRVLKILGDAALEEHAEWILHAPRAVDRPEGNPAPGADSAGPTVRSVAARHDLVEHDPPALRTQLPDAGVVAQPVGALVPVARLAHREHQVAGRRGLAVAAARTGRAVCGEQGPRPRCADAALDERAGAPARPERAVRQSAARQRV